MRKINLIWITFLFIFFGQPFLATASEIPVGHAPEEAHDEGLKFYAKGFLAVESFYDTTRSYTESFQNLGVSRPGTVAGDEGRTQMSSRNSMLGVGVYGPVLNGWKIKGYYEMDFNGFNPTPPGATGAPESESAFFTNPTFRQRQAYIEATNDSGWHFIAGQTWQLLGFNPIYAGTGLGGGASIGVFTRIPEIEGVKDITIGEAKTLQTAIAVSKPSQRDSEIPNIDVGARLIFDGRRAAHFPATPFQPEVKARPMSIAASATFRQFTTPNASTLNTADRTQYYGGAFSIDALIPIIPSPDGKELRNNLALLGEYAMGSGYSDSFFNWSGNMAAMNTGTTPATKTLPNIDGGQSGFDASGNFQLVQTQTFTAQLEYTLPTEALLFIKTGYGQIMSPNIANLTPVTTGLVSFDKNELYFANITYQITDNLRASLEGDKILTHYTDGVYPGNYRFELGLYYIFF